MQRTVQIATLAALTIALAGCLDVHRPIVDPTIMDTADHDWTVRLGIVEEDSDYASKVVETEYRYDPDEDDPGFPGLLVLVGLRTLQKIDEQQLVDATRTILAEEMEEQGVEADSVTEETGTRTIESGVSTRWLSMTGTATSEALLFSEAREIRVLGEAWFDEPSNMHVVAIVIAQTVQSDFVGGEQRDHGVWNELVGDEEGTIGGATHPEGFIDHAIIDD